MRTFRACIFSLLLVFLSPPLYGSTVTGNLRDLVGSAVTANASVTFELINTGTAIPRIPTSGLTGVIVRSPVTAAPNSNGNFSATVRGNDAILPANTYYRVCLWNQGAKYRCDYYQFQDSQSYDLAQTTPFVPPVPLPTSITTGASYTATFTSALSWTINHNFNSLNLVCQAFDTNSQFIVPDTFVKTSLTAATMTFTVAQAGSATCYNYTAVVSTAKAFSAGFAGASTWAVNHNFGNANVVCEFFDTSGKLIYPDTFVRTNANTATASFTYAASGSATCVQ